MRRLSEVERAEIWDALERGEPIRGIARRLGRGSTSVRMFLVRHGGSRPRPPSTSTLRLSLAEREEISRGLAAGQSLRAIAASLHRAPSTISREVLANGHRGHYRALSAERASRRRARRPKLAKLAACPRLRREVEAHLARYWSPQQISAWLALTYPDDPEMSVSHETIYASLFVQGRGALRHELHRCLRSGRALRRPRARTKGGLHQGQITNMVMISERPAEAEDRAVPGHWEGDLIMGKRRTAIVSLVERQSRYLMLLALPQGIGAESVRSVIAKRIVTLPAELRRSLTWDQGKEMAQHVRFSVDTGIQVYFCDPNAPWQRGANENTNGLVRQYLPRLTDLSGQSQGDLNKIARSLNTRPRQTLGWMTPSEAFAKAVALTP
ncbi:MAG: IS30 family transposase [Acidimicrobiaceae bacterium]|nr:IS30 family transposase [Acidimicrobiaceae bacterium]